MAKKLRSLGGKSYRQSGNKKPDMSQIMKQASKAQEEMKKIEEEFETKTFEATSGGGAVKIVMTGGHRIESLEFDDDLLEEKEDLKDMITAALNQVIETIEKEKEESMNSITGGLGLPDLGF